MRKWKLPITRISPRLLVPAQLVFWTEGTSSEPAIWAQHMDGTGRRLVTRGTSASPLLQPFSVTLGTETRSYAGEASYIPGALRSVHPCAI